jgi:hypothetical protein
VVLDSYGEVWLPLETSWGGVMLLVPGWVCMSEIVSGSRTYGYGKSSRMAPIGVVPLLEVVSIDTFNLYYKYSIIAFFLWT